MSSYHNSAFNEQPGLEVNVQPAHAEGLETAHAQGLETAPGQGLEPVNHHPIQSPAPSQQYYDAPQPYHDAAHHPAQQPYNDAVVPSTQDDPGQHHYAYKGAESQPMIAPPVYSSHNEKASRQSRICGLKRSLFFGLLALLVFCVIALAVGLGVGLSHHSSSSSRSHTSKNGTSTTSTSSTATATSTPVAVAVAGTNSLDDGTPINLIYQDGATNDLYINAHTGGKWTAPIKINNLNPQPKASTPLAAVQFPGATDVQVFYLSDNNTMFGAIGPTDSSNWAMGSLGPQTNYAVLVANNTGFGASPWMNDVDSRYSTRIYYVDRTSLYWHELAQDPGYDWAITSQIGTEQVLGTSQMAVAWRPGASFADPSIQEEHIFYQDTRNELRHQFSLNGNWNNSNVENIVNFPSGSSFAATIINNTATTSVGMNVFWISNGQKLQSVAGKSTKLGTFGSVSAVPNADTAKTGGGAVAATTWGTSLRVYYQGNTNPDDLLEVGLDGNTWSTDGSTNPS